MMLFVHMVFLLCCYHLSNVRQKSLIFCLVINLEYFSRIFLDYLCYYLNSPIYNLLLLVSSALCRYYVIVLLLSIDPFFFFAILKALSLSFISFIRSGDIQGYFSCLILNFLRGLNNYINFLGYFYNIVHLSETLLALSYSSHYVSCNLR